MERPVTSAQAQSSTPWAGAVGVTDSRALALKGAETDIAHETDQPSEADLRHICSKQAAVTQLAKGLLEGAEFGSFCFLAEDLCVSRA